MSDIFADMAKKIITEQEAIIGPVAWEEAKKVKGISVDVSNRLVSLSAKNPSFALEALVKQYERLFGQASVEVCKDAIKGLLSQVKKDKIPAILV